MNRILFSLSLLALALCGGCADTYYTSPYAYTTAPSYAYSTSPAYSSRTIVTTTRTTTMGAGPVVTGTMCRDGTMLPANSACALHGGVDRQTTYYQSYPRY